MEWEDAEDIGEALLKAYPDQDPMRLSFPKLHKMIIELPGFKDDPQRSNEGILEAIQMAWYEEYQSRSGGKE